MSSDLDELAAASRRQPAARGTPPRRGSAETLPYATPAPEPHGYSIRITHVGLASIVGWTATVIGGLIAVVALIGFVGGAVGIWSRNPFGAPLGLIAAGASPWAFTLGVLIMCAGQAVILLVRLVRLAEARTRK